MREKINHRREPVMRDRTATKVTLRLFVLVILWGVLAFLYVPPKSQASPEDECLACDQAEYQCMYGCNEQHDNCLTLYSSFFCDAQYTDCINNYTSGCWPVYSRCLEGCFPSPSGGGGGGGCGRGRTQCELSCRDGRGQCAADGGTDCGAEYEACLSACCP